MIIFKDKELYEKVKTFGGVGMNLYCDYLQNEKMPFLEIPEGVVLTPLIPFGGAIFRCLFALKSNPENTISVYLDWWSMLGYMKEPYWEIYDGKKTYRFFLNETKQLMKKVFQLLKKMNKNNK